MPRLSVTLSNAMHSHLSLLAEQHNASIGGIINQLLHVGIRHFDIKQEGQARVQIDKHFGQLIIQMNVLIKNMAAAALEYDQEYFEGLYQASADKYEDLAKSHS